jgi:hypothetical protein
MRKDESNNLKERKEDKRSHPGISKGVQGHKEGKKT